MSHKQSMSRDGLVGRAIAASWAALLIPVGIDVWDGAHPTWFNLARSVVLAIFAAIYVVGWFVLSDDAFVRPHWRKDALVWLVLLLGPVLLGLPILQGTAATMLPLVAASAMWVLPLKVGIATAALLTVIPLVGLVGHIPKGLVVGLLTAFVSCLLGRIAQHEGIRAEDVRQQVAMADERERVARDVHDVLGHSLTAISVKSDLARQLIHRDPDAAAAQMAEVHDLSRAALAEIRETVAGLRVARLDDELESARATLSDAGITPVIHGEVRDVDPRHRIVAAWAVRELVTNVVRHSNATTCTITLRSDGVEVSDDGIGLAAAGAPPEGNGLRGVRQRVEGAGGHVDIHDTGVRVVLGTA